MRENKKGFEPRTKKMNEKTQKIIEKINKMKKGVVYDVEMPNNEMLGFQNLLNRLYNKNLIPKVKTQKADNKLQISLNE